MKRHELFTALILSAFTVPALAQNASTPNIDQRQENQQKRIEKGVQSGALTAKETQRLETSEAKLATDQQAAKADGTVTRAERRKLRHEENKSSRAIYRKKHNDKTTSPAS